MTAADWKKPEKPTYTSEGEQLLSFIIYVLVPPKIKVWGHSRINVTLGLSCPL